MGNILYQENDTLEMRLKRVIGYFTNSFIFITIIFIIPFSIYIGYEYQYLVALLIGSWFLLLFSIMVFTNCYIRPNIPIQIFQDKIKMPLTYMERKFFKPEVIRRENIKNIKLFEEEKFNGKVGRIIIIDYMDNSYSTGWYKSFDNIIQIMKIIERHYSEKIRP